MPNMRPRNPHSGLHLVTSQRKILLVNDEPGSEPSRLKTLQDLGYEVTPAATARHALKCWRDEDYDLILIGLEKDPQGAAHLCERIMSEAPRQKIALLFSDPELPLTDCPDLIWKGE